MANGTLRDLDAWILSLRERLTRGELETLDPIDFGYGTAGLSGERIVQIMLSDLDDLDSQEVSGDNPYAARAERRRRLLDDFRRLREQLY